MPGSLEAQERLLHALAEQLKLPLLQIARQAELGAAEANDSIRYIAHISIQLIDGYLLGMGQEGQQQLELEPVSVSSMLQNTAHKLYKLAKDHDCDLEVRLAGRYGPVMANRQSVEAAFTMLGYSMIESQVANGQRHRLIFGAHKSQKGLVTGIFTSEANITTDALRRARALYGTASQPIPSLSVGTGAGIFVADSILANMATPLHVAKHNKLTGLAATLLPSRQMQLV
jgi:hypothetical protein